MAPKTKSSRSAPNRLVKKTETLFFVIRALMQGCLSRPDFKALGLSEQSYDEYWALVRWFVPNEALRYTVNERRTQGSFNGDSYQLSDNPFAFAFSMYAFNPKNTAALTSICAKMAEKKIPLRSRDFSFSSSVRVPDCLDELVEYGAVRRKEIKGNTCYILIRHPFDKLCTEELRALIPAIDFYKHVWLLSFPGYMLQHTLETLTKTKKQTYFQFPAPHHERLLQEEKIIALSQYIAGEENITFSYPKNNGKPDQVHTISSPSMTIDCLHGRDSLGGNTYLLERMYNLSQADDDAVPENRRKKKNIAQNRQKKSYAIPVRLHFKTPGERDALLLHMRRHFLDMEKISSADRSMDLCIQVQDLLHYVPVLEQFGAALEVLCPPAEDVSKRASTIGHVRTRILQNARAALGNEASSSHSSKSGMEFLKRRKGDKTEHPLFTEMNSWIVRRLFLLLRTSKAGQTWTVSELQQYLSGSLGRDDLVYAKIKELLYYLTEESVLEPGPDSILDRDEAYMRRFLSPEGSESYTALPENEREASKSLNLGEEKEFLKKTPDEQKNFLSKLRKEIFMADKSQKLTLPSISFPLIRNKYEMCFLKALAYDEEYSFLLPPALREKLQMLCRGVPDLLPPEKWRRNRAKGDDPRNEPIHGFLSKVMEAIRTRHQLRCTCADGRKIEAPLYRLSYDAAGNVYTLELWDENTASLFPLPLSSVHSLSLSNQSAPDHLEDQVKSYLEKERRECTLLLIKGEEKNARIRCFSLFAPYDKDVWFDEKTDTYRMKIHYYSFEEEDVIRRLLSLSRFVKIEGPASIQNLVTGRLQDIEFLYEDSMQPEAPLNG